MGWQTDYSFGHHQSPELLKALLGKVFSKVYKINQDHADQVIFEAGSERYILEHHQDCCEYVFLESITGDLADLVNTPILVAEERTNDEDPPPEAVAERGWAESHLWTFYTFRTIKGSVDLRWYGESNGYYSERVSLVRQVLDT